MAVDSPYPELKKTHTMAHVGRPWRDVKPPAAASVWGVIQGFADYQVLVAALQLGLFDAVAELSGLDPAAPPSWPPRAPRVQPVTIEAIAARIDARPGPLAAVVDAVVALGFMEVVGAGSDVEGVVLADSAERYLTTAGPASMVDLVGVANGPAANWAALADTVRGAEPPEPVDEDAAFYRPLVTATFPTQLRAAGRLMLRIAMARTPGVRVLDLGAGAAPWAIAVLQASAGSTAVVNDLPDVLPLAQAKVAELGLADRVELRAGDYFTIDVEPAGYDVVVLGHVCRAEGAERAPQLIERARAALRPGGRLILADYFRGATRTGNPFAARMGATIVASTRRGDTFTGPQVVGWLHDAGFVDVRLIEPIGGQYAYVAAVPR